METRSKKAANGSKISRERHESRRGRRGRTRATSVREERMEQKNGMSFGAPLSGFGMNLFMLLRDDNRLSSVYPRQLRNVPFISQLLHRNQLWWRTKIIDRIRSLHPVDVAPVHAKRITALEWAPCESESEILVSASKDGSVRVLNFEARSGEMTARTCAIEDTYRLDLIVDFQNVHHGSVYSVRFEPVHHRHGSPDLFFTCSSDGTVAAGSLRTQSLQRAIVDVNEDELECHQCSALDVDAHHGPFRLVLGTSSGRLIFFDPRSNRLNFPSAVSKSKLAKNLPGFIHQKKISFVHVHPHDGNVLATASNDYSVKIWDVRKLDELSPTNVFEHAAVVNSSVFSPRFGDRLLVTTQDNGLFVYSFESGVSRLVGNHSHEFSRWLSPFQAHWIPGRDDLFSIGRLAPAGSVDRIGGSPVDIFEVDMLSRKLNLVASLRDEEMDNISPLIKFHPYSLNMACGSSRSVFVWTSSANVKDSHGVESQVLGKRTRASLDAEESSDHVRRLTEPVSRRRNPRVRLEHDTLESFAEDYAYTLDDEDAQLEQVLARSLQER